MNRTLVLVAGLLALTPAQADEGMWLPEQLPVLSESLSQMGLVLPAEQLADPLSMNNRDIQGTSVEFYDVHYSDIDGNFDIDGSYLTIAGSFGAKLPAGGGLNLAEISLNYEDNSVEYGSFLASFVALGDNAFPDTAELAIDGDLQTHTVMGNNVDEPDKRLRVTLGFMSSLVPE